MILNKIQKHNSGWIKAIFAMFIVSLFANSVWSNIEKIADYKDQQKDVSEFFLYQEGNETVPVKEVFAVGEYPTLYSNLEYFQPIQMTWYDTLYCDSKKYKTQEWSEFIDEPNVVSEFDGTYWSYTEQVVKKERTKCSMCSVVIGTTTRGNDKITSFCSANFAFKHKKNIINKTPNK